jgi:hypothetical protein
MVIVRGAKSTKGEGMCAIAYSLYLFFLNQ